MLLAAEAPRSLTRRYTSSRLAFLIEAADDDGHGQAAIVRFSCNGNMAAVVVCRGFLFGVTPVAQPCVTKSMN